MAEHVSYTTEEVAGLLRVSKLTVYDLIKKGELTAYRVGKQMRIDADDLEAYKAKAKREGAAASTRGAAADLRNAVVLGQEAASLSNPTRVEAGVIVASVAGVHFAGAVGVSRTSGMRPVVITGQDVSLDILAKYMEKKLPEARPLRSYAGSLESLIAMVQGQSDVVSTHLLDGDTGTYNVPYIRKILTGHRYVVMNMLSRPAGLYVQKGNPKGIAGWSDLAMDGIRLANREKGSGARVLLDEQLRLHGIDAERVNGYEAEETSHLGVAGKVASGEADVGVGAEKAAFIVGVDFVPLIQERYDLVMLKEPHRLEWIAAVRDILRSDAFRSELSSIGGYDLSLTGEVIFET